MGYLPPLVQEAPRSGLACIGLYALAATVAGAALGALLGLAGRLALAALPDGSVGPAFAVLAAGCAARDLGWLRLRLPDPRRQLPDLWLYNYGPARAAMLYGAGMGCGVTTYIRFAGFYVVLAWAALQGPAGGAAVMGLYGALKSLPVVLAGGAALRRRRAFLHAEALSQPLLHRLVGTATLALAALALATG